MLMPTTQRPYQFTPTLRYDDDLEKCRMQKELTLRTLSDIQKQERLILRRKSQLYQPSQQRLKIENKSYLEGEISLKNKRKIESLAKNYSQFEQNVRKYQSSDQKLRNFDQKIKQTTKELKKLSSKRNLRIATMPQVEDYLDSTYVNAQVHEKLNQNYKELKRFAHQYKVPLYRKVILTRAPTTFQSILRVYNGKQQSDNDKTIQRPHYYNPQITKDQQRYKKSRVKHLYKANTSPTSLGKSSNRKLPQISPKKHSLKQALAKDQVNSLGNNYLHYSKNVGKTAKSLKKQKSVIRFVKEVFHSNSKNV